MCSYAKVSVSSVDAEFLYPFHQIHNDSDEHDDCYELQDLEQSRAEQIDDHRTEIRSCIGRIICHFASPSFMFNPLTRTDR